MSDSWKLTAHASRQRVQAALLAHEEAEDWDHAIVLSGSEIAEDRPDEWVLEAWLDREPGAAQREAVAALFGGSAPELTVERIAAADWLKLSQEGVDPITAGRFRVRTPDHAAAATTGDKPRMTEFVIPTSQAFGTGQHETTAGCLAMLDIMKRQGVVARNMADIGTGTGLLAFAAIALWPRAYAVASDVDGVCAQVVHDNAVANQVAQGGGAGALTMVVAAGMDHSLLRARGPYDLLMANILAGPLIDLAPDFARAVLPGGHVVLAGLLVEQEAAVRRAYRRAGFRLARRMVRGDWAILWLRKRDRRPG